MRFGVLAAALIVSAPAARGGHEVSYYPSFYPQEIRVERLDPEAAAREFSNPRDPLHAYLGAAPRFAGRAPGGLKTAVSLASFIVAAIDTGPQRVTTPAQRCRALAAASVEQGPDVVAHAYPVTPYHPDYLDHAGVPLARGAAAPTLPADVRLEEVAIATLLREGGIGHGLWPAPPWAKEGWFHAWLLLRPALADGPAQARADAIYAQLQARAARDDAEGANLARELVATLNGGCERRVIGYRLRREHYSDDFSSGVENIAVDSQSGFNAPVVVRTLKLKDLPWNGWLRLGIAEAAEEAWNPVAGFGDAAGRLVWSIVGDDAFLPVPSNGSWAPNRVEVRPDAAARRQSVRVPEDALAPEPGSGRMRPVAAGTSAMAKVTYRVLASAFQDGSPMDLADLIYPYALAYRWGHAPGEVDRFDPDVASATRLLRKRFKGVRLLRVEESRLAIADQVFTYRSPIVEVYVDDGAADPTEHALGAPPWSSVPWHLLALMEAAVERGIAAFSRAEARRRNLPWLDLVRDRAQREAMLALIGDFARTGYRPAAIKDIVSPEAATARWRALSRFVETHGHLLVTNGPYRLARYTPESVSFDVIREFTYPVGIGTFDEHAYPPRALVTRMEHIGRRVLITAEVEIAVKQQRDRKLVRMPLRRDTLRGLLPIRPRARFVVVGENGRVAAAGFAGRDEEGRFAAPMPELAPGRYSFFAAVFADGNAADPVIGRIDLQVD